MEISENFREFLDRLEGNIGKKKIERFWETKEHLMNFRINF